MREYYLMKCSAKHERKKRKIIGSNPLMIYYSNYEATKKLVVNLTIQ